MIKKFNSKMTDHGSWGTWWFNIIPITYSENDQICFYCWNENNTHIEQQIELDLSESYWLTKLRKVTAQTHQTNTE